MTGLARTLCTLYTTSAIWLAYLTLSTYQHIPLWASILTTAASLACVAAIADTTATADDLRELRIQLERAARPASDLAPRPAPERGVMSPQERAVFEEIEARYRKDDAA